MTMFNWRALASSLGLVLAAASSCGQDPTVPVDLGADGTGEVAVALQVGPSIIIANADFVIVNNDIGFTRSGMVAVGFSADVLVPIQGLPIANRYSITVTANVAGGIVTCLGTGGFDVRANSRATVVVHLVCREPPRTGSIQVAGPINVCPLLDSLGASPDHVMVGGKSFLSATAHDADSGPSGLTYAWSASSGTLSSTTAPNPTFTCTQAGTVTITTKVSDGDVDPTCADALSINVNCKVAQ